MSKSPKPVNFRIRVVHWGILFSFILLAGRLTYLQVVKYPQFQAHAARQQLKPVKIAAKRGVITDRKERNLAIDIKAHSVYIDPLYFKDSAQDVAKQIAPILAMKEPEVYKILTSKYWRYIKRKPPEEAIKRIRELKIKGIGILEESKRVYPNNKLAASLLGFTDIDNQGQEGVEKSFDQFLKGGATSVNIITDAYGNELLRKDGNLPLLTEKAKANKVVLSIDEDLQYLAERELYKSIDDLGAERGAVIIMDSQNGDLLSLATYPTYDPNSLEERKKHAQVKNWTVTDFYEPGSVMKIFTMAAALEDKKVSVDEVIPCPGLIHVDVWRVHDHDMPAHQVRYFKPANIIEVSSNVGSSIIGRRMKPEDHRNYLTKFGFGRKTGSELSGEVPGILPALPWRASHQSTISFGQGVAVTPLQVVTALSAIPNKGIRVEPRIVKKILSPEDKVIKEMSPKTSRTMSADTADKMLKMMTMVVEGEHGTGRDTKIPGYIMAGKTGTADKVVNGRYNGEVMASFVGFLPADNPRFIIYVLLDSPKEAHFASMTAVPVFRAIAEKVITYYDLEPTRHEELEKQILLELTDDDNNTPIPTEKFESEIKTEEKTAPKSQQSP